MKTQLVDRKNWLNYWFWHGVNVFVNHFHFRTVQFTGVQHIPTGGPFMIVSNHTSRWDGLLMYELIDRPANFIVSPNELKGFQGRVLSSMGAFPASKQFDLQAHVESIWKKCEGLVIFPEGDVYRDGSTHRFMSGAARFVLNAAKKGIDVPIVPCAINYSDDGKRAHIQAAPAVMPEQYIQSFVSAPNETVRRLTERLHREVCLLRNSLVDKAALYANVPSERGRLAQTLDQSERGRLAHTCTQFNGSEHELHGGETPPLRLLTQ